MSHKYPPINSGPNQTIYREELAAGNRTYDFVVNENSTGLRHLAIVERRSDGVAEQGERVMVPEQQLQAFHETYYKATRYFSPQPRAHRIEEIRKQYHKAYGRWTAEEDIRLADEYNRGAGVGELAKALQRPPGGILFRLLHLGLIRP